ncbi:hypothetical protein T440DRAFT_473841 [Plenodomus tracheiphilus IPT5]|uniref:Uncharacterized protein n=1 Tax=Plenodomus tracheiphilus IPT5 TaxID=1408161 RepID=A0A6A7ALR5_9PLEO|nr:hypothetical protein T440DRAFT_473841 [Plenodomus tracheiphilus IPT5]
MGNNQDAPTISPLHTKFDLYIMPATSMVCCLSNARPSQLMGKAHCNIPMLLHGYQTSVAATIRGREMKAPHWQEHPQLVYKDSEPKTQNQVRASHTPREKPQNRQQMPQQGTTQSPRNRLRCRTATPRPKSRSQCAQTRNPGADGDSQRQRNQQAQGICTDGSGPISI